MKLYHITDTHYLSKKYWEINPFDTPQIKDQTQRAESEEILKTALNMILSDDECDLLIISGDISDNGEPESHKEVIEILRNFKKSGKRVYITTATHDYGIPEDLSYGYDKNGKRVYNIKKVPRNKLYDMYYEFGFNEAIALHQESMSYIIQLEENVRLFMLNDDNECQLNNNNWGWNKDCFNWICGEVKKAKDTNQEIIAVTHHPITISAPIYNIIDKRAGFSKKDGLIDRLADLGVKVFLTGHSHIQSIDCQQTEKGNHIYDISTGSLIGSPPVFRKIDYDVKNNIMDIKTLIVEDPKGVDLRGLHLKEFARENFIGYIEELFHDAAFDYEQFSQKAKDFSMSYKKAKRLRPILQPLAKFFNKLTFKRIGRWTKKENGLSREEINLLSDKKVSPVFFDMIAKVFEGDPNYSPDTPEYKIIMSIIAIMEDFLRVLHIDIKPKLNDSDLSSIIGEMLFNSNIPDNDAIIDLKKVYFSNKKVYKYTSKKGGKILAILVMCGIIFLPLILLTGIIVGIGIGYKKLCDRKIK